jgi:hypothetical protein
LVDFLSFGSEPFRSENERIEFPPDFFVFAPFHGSSAAWAAM